MKCENEFMDDDEDDAIEFYAKQKAKKNQSKAAKPQAGQQQVFQSAKVYDVDDIADLADGELGHLNNEQKLELVTDSNG